MSVQAFEIPLSATNQQCTVTLGGKTYTLTVIWRDDPGGMGGWMLDIGDASNNPILQGIALTTGTDLLNQYPDLDFGGKLEVQTDHNPTAPPTFTNLGQQSHLYWIPQ